MGSKGANLKKRMNKLSNEKKKEKKNKKTLNSDPSPVGPPRHGGEATAGGRKVVTDPRFLSMHTNPRFARAPKHKTKLAIDERFGCMFADKSFLSSSAPVDKRGKRIKSNSRHSTLRRYYKIGVQPKGRQEVAEEEGCDEEDNEKEEEVEEIGEEEDEEGQKLVKPKGLKSGDDTEDESISDLMSEEPKEEEVFFER